MAAGLINRFLGQQWRAESAGVQPADAVNPLAIEVMAELGIDISYERPKSVNDFYGQHFDLVVTVCDEAAENCPLWLDKGAVVHIAFEDPAAAMGRLDNKLKVFRRVRDDMRKSVLSYLQQLFSFAAGAPPSPPAFANGQTQLVAKMRTGAPMRLHFQQELRRIQDELLMLGSMVAHALRESLEILRQQDLDHARQIIADDRAVNAKRYKLEEDCLTLIATQQPMARDMRLIAAIIEIASELERMGDYAKGIGRITLYIGKTPLVKPLVHMPQMCDIVVAMLRAALDAFIAQDIEQARAIPKRDDEVDALYNKINRELIDIILADPSRIDHANYLLWAAHNLERGGDRVTNICERIIYTVTGKFVELDHVEQGMAGTE